MLTKLDNTYTVAYAPTVTGSIFIRRYPDYVWNRVAVGAVSSVGKIRAVPVPQPKWRRPQSRKNKGSSCSVTRMAASPESAK